MGDDLIGSAATRLDGAAGRAPPASDDQALPTIDRAHYRVDSELARGGMGRIFLARDRRLGRNVAVKEALVTEDAFLVRFDREVRLTARLQHPGIVSIYEAGRWPTGEPFYAMRLIAGRPLSSVIAETTTLAQRLALIPNVLAVAEALAYAHDQRIIHRDLKPANVLVGTFGETVVIDWGLAKDLDDTRAGDETGPYADTGEGALTMLGSVMGTPSYMPIEQATGQAVDARADVYAIGAILYEVLCGKPPYEGPTGMSILGLLVAQAPPALAARATGVPADLLAIVDRAMARDADRRYRTAKDTHDRLALRETPQQRAADALVDIVSAAEAVERGEATTTSLPVAAAQLQVLIPYTDLLDRTAASGLLSDGTPLSAGELRILACQADLIPVVLGSKGQVLDLGQTVRLAPPPLRRAIGLRDGGCAFPGCTTPMRHCDLHHIRPWQDGGPTNRDNIVALCRVHHSLCEPRPPTTSPDGHPVIPDGWDVRIDHRGLPEFLPPTALDPTRTPIHRVRHTATLFDHDQPRRAG